MKKERIARKVTRVAVIGGGPAGSTLSTLLARKGVKVIQFASPVRPELVIGESLVPACIPLLQKLGVEKKIASLGTLKPGATFSLFGEDETNFVFSDHRGKGHPGYAYNVLRKEFDEVLFAHTQTEGVHAEQETAELSYDKENDAFSLTGASKEKAQDLLHGEPELLIDATGRTRLFSRIAGIPSTEGERKDTALFAHLEGVSLQREGHIHVNRLRKGWSWRIPLRGRVSVGIVAPSEYVRSFGESLDEQYDALRAHDPILAPFASSGHRISKVVKYSNYQLCSHRMFGANWVLVGDAAGFIDPIFSSGTLLALQGGALLAQTILDASSFLSYEQRCLKELHAWHRMVGYFYDGRFFNLIRLGKRIEENLWGKLIGSYTMHHLARILTGVAPAHFTTQRYLTFMMEKIIGTRECRLRIR